MTEYLTWLTTPECVNGFQLLAVFFVGGVLGIVIAHLGRLGS